MESPHTVATVYEPPYLLLAYIDVILLFHF